MCVCVHERTERICIDAESIQRAIERDRDGGEM